MSCNHANDKGTTNKISIKNIGGVTNAMTFDLHEDDWVILMHSAQLMATLMIKLTQLHIRVLDKPFHCRCLTMLYKDPAQLCRGEPFKTPVF